jgi:signal transduction histidine kinase
VQLLMPLLLGPWLGSRVRALGLPEAREHAALVAAVVATVLAVLAFHRFAAEPMKQGLAELTGAVDASGQRRRTPVAIGVIVRNPEHAAAASAAGAQRPSPETRVSNAIASIAVSFWLAGGVALWGWRRERAGLAALARERELAQAQAQRREAELQLSVLAAQVEPHFLFNTLAGVRSAIATDPARASEMIDRLVDYLRAAIPRLRSSGGSEATLGGQLEIVRAYLGLMAARLPRLRCTIDAAPELLAAPCPPLMLISLAENAVKHGAEPKIGPVHIEVQARRNAAGGLDVTVADDGAGFDASAGGSGIGLSNIRERLRQMYGDGASLQLRARPQGGVAATLSLPPE